MNDYKKKTGQNCGGWVHRICFAICVVIVMFVFILPLLWILSISLKKQIDIIAQPPKILFQPVLDYYIKVVHNADVLKGSLNSVICTFGTLLIGFLVGIPGAYAMARFSFIGKRVMMLWILMGLMIPLASLIIPFYMMFKRIGLLDTLSGLIIVYLLIDIPFVVWMMGINLKEVPIEIDESATLDGCNTLQLLVHILIPISKPGIASAAISCIIATWNEFLFAMILTQSKAKTAPVVISGFMSTSGMRWGEMAAVATFLIIPPAVFGIAIQKNYIRGLTAGAVIG